MMNTIFVDAEISDASRLDLLYAGQLFMYTPRPSTKALCEHARELSEEAFAPLDPREAQYSLPVEKYVEILAELKPKFIHSPESKQLIQAVLEDFGCDLEKTYFDVPRLRTSTSDGYLTSGLAYAFHPHRDTWYSAPFMQINWWLPVYPFEADSGLAMHPQYWDRSIKNCSSCYNYQRWNVEGRKQAALQKGEDTRVQPRAEEQLHLDPDVRIVCQPGGLIMFSAAHLHSSVPNTSGKTRFSIDFRTVHIDDVEAERGAPNIDSHCTGTPLRDYLRGTDLAHLPDDLIVRYGENIYEQEKAQSSSSE